MELSYGSCPGVVFIVVVVFDDAVVGGGGGVFHTSCNLGKKS